MLEQIMLYFGWQKTKSKIIVKTDFFEEQLTVQTLDKVSSKLESILLDIKQGKRKISKNKPRVCDRYNPSKPRKDETIFTLRTEQEQEAHRELTKNLEDNKKSFEKSSNNGDVK